MDGHSQSLVTPSGFDRQVTKKTQVGKLEFAEGCEAIGFEGAQPWRAGRGVAVEFLVAHGW